MGGELHHCCAGQQSRWPVSNSVGPRRSGVANHRLHSTGLVLVETSAVTSSATHQSLRKCCFDANGPPASSSLEISLREQDSSYTSGCMQPPQAQAPRIGQRPVDAVLASIHKYSNEPLPVVWLQRASIQTHAPLYSPSIVPPHFPPQRRLQLQLKSERRHDEVKPVLVDCDQFKPDKPIQTRTSRHCC